MPKVWLDAGHGGKDPGAVGNGLRECDLALSITLKLGCLLWDDGRFTVGYSRTKDVFVELSERARMANAWLADLFFSVHLNAFSDPNAHGVEALDFNGTGLGYRVANELCGRLARRFDLRNRGVIHTQRNFAVIRETDMPSVIAEAAFITNSEDIHKFDEDREQWALAWEYYASICAAFDLAVQSVDKSMLPLPTAKAANPEPAAYDHGKALAQGLAKAGVIQSPDFWEAAIEGRVVPKPDEVRALFTNFVNAGSKYHVHTEDTAALLGGALLFGAVTTPLYWEGVMAGKEVPKSEYVQYLFENMMKAVA